MKLEGQTLDIYAVGEELGRGGMGAVYKAQSTAEGVAGPPGSVVAIKVFHSHLVEDQRTYERFRREAEIGRSIHHPHVVRTFGTGEARINGESCHYMVMEFIEGQTLAELRAELGTVPDHLLFQVADQALDALAAIHERGIIHRDIKPENIVITGEHRVLLMDLGVARLVEHGRTLTQSGEFVGSLPYAAPEQFDAGAELGPGCDLYSFGVVLFELATGRNPFDTGELATLLQQKLYADIERPRLEFPDIDDFWDEVIFTSVERDPDRRFQSAAELRTILQEGRQSEWWRRRTAGRVLPGAERALKRLRMVREAPLIGRRTEFGRLQDLYREAQGGDGRILLVSGAAGVGKSRLIYNFVQELSSASGPLVLAGRAVGPGGRAYQPFVEVAHDLLRIEEMELDGRRESLQAELGRLLPETPGVVANLAEFLLAGLNPDEASGFTRDALMSSLANLLRRTAADRPLVVVIEDLHLAGTESIDLFGYLARCLPGHRILLAGVYEDDEVEDGSELHGMIAALGSREDADSIVLEPLSRPASDELLRTLVVYESTVRALGNTLHEKSDGNPQVILEILAHLKATGALEEWGDGLRVKEEVEAVELPETVTEILGLKFGRLDEEQRETLEAAAVLGQEFEASLLAAVMEERRIRLLKRLAVLERKHRLIRSSGKDSFSFARRQIREVLYQDISPALRSEYHSVVAEAIQTLYADDPERIDGKMAFALVRHLLEAERALEGEPYLDKALVHVAGNYHATYSAPLLERLAAAFTVGRAPARFAISMGLWAVYEMLGRVEDQRRVLEEAREFADEMGEPARRGQVHSNLAVTLWRTGEHDRAEQEAERGLALAREAGDRIWESKSLHTLGVVAHHRGDYTHSAPRFREALDIRREIGDRRGVASSLQALASAMHYLGEAPEEVLDTKQASLEIFREIGDRRGESMLLNDIGHSLVNAGRIEEGLAHCRRATVLCRELGDHQGEVFPLSNEGRALALLGRHEEAVAAFERALDLVRQLQNRNAELWVQVALGGSLTKIGEYDQAQAHLDEGARLAESVDARNWLVIALRSLGDTLHRRGRREEAWSNFDRALKVADELGEAGRRAETLHWMGAAALREDDHPRARELLLGALEMGGDLPRPDETRALLISRLARAEAGCGHADAALSRGEEAERLVEGCARLSADAGPEIHYHLGGVAREDDRRRYHLARARDLVEKQGQAIRHDAHREHFLHETWPNREILARG